MRYIDAYEVKRQIQKATEGEVDVMKVFLKAMYRIDKIPTADVRENVKAHWIDMKPTGDDRFMCSRCKWKEKVPTIMGEPIVWDYCPSCES